LSPLVAIDRERCILCYRCVRFSQEVAEDEQLQLLERGDRSFVGTFDDRPYVAPFHGNITDLCPVGALTSYTYRFRARPWDIENSGSVCTLCPSQCNVSFTIRDEEVKRVVARDNPDVDDGWLCDRGRYGFEMFTAEQRVTGPRLRGGVEVGWAEAIEKAAAGLNAAGAASAAIIGDASNEEGYLVQRIVREALGSPHVDSRVTRGLDRDQIIRLADPAISARVRDIDSADAVLVIGTDPLHSSPILDLRIRKAIRRNGTRVAVATDRPTALDGGAEAVARYSPVEADGFLTRLVDALRDDSDNDATPVAEALRGAESVVIVWGEQVGAWMHELADVLGLAEKDGSGLLEVPELANARGLREAGCLPDAGPGLIEPKTAFVPSTGANAAFVGKDSEGIREALDSGELRTLILFGVDPLRDFPGTEAWKRALAAADHLVVFSTFENQTTTMADIVFPLETHAEKDGTVTHPEGRLQRVRPSASRPGDIRPNWGVLAELSLALGHDTGVSSQPTAFAALTEAVPFYAGISDAEIGGRGVRWQDRPEAKGLPKPGGDGGTTPAQAQSSAEAAPPSPSSSGGGLALGTYRDLWVGPITELNPPLRFLEPRQRVEISVADAERLGVKHGDEVRVGENGTSVRARVEIRGRVADGVCFLIEGTAEGNANLLNGGPAYVDIEKAGT
ncbi:MAG TPA: molybdopterin-dependent oxidoreductase, partial [Solirubrobacterales bacterium]